MAGAKTGPSFIAEAKRLANLALDEYWDGPAGEAPLPVRWEAWNRLQQVCNRACAALGEGTPEADVESRFLVRLGNELRQAIVETIRMPVPYILAVSQPPSPREGVSSASRALVRAGDCVREAPDLAAAFRRAVAFLHAAVVGAHGRLLAQDGRAFLPHHARQCQRLADAAGELLQSPEVAWYADVSPKQNRRRIMYEELTGLAASWRATADAIESNPPAKRTGAPPTRGITYKAARHRLREAGIPDRVAQAFLRAVRP